MGRGAPGSGLGAGGEKIGEAEEELLVHPSCLSLAGCALTLKLGTA